MAKASLLEPSHFLLGLCKVVDLDLTELINKETPDRNDVLEEMLREVRKLRGVFCAAGFDAKLFRRRLRRLLPTSTAASENPGRLRRSQPARELFDEAEKYALFEGSSVYPIHLLNAILMAKIPESDELITEMGFDKKRLLQTIKDQLLANAGKPSGAKSNSRAKWN